MRTVPLIVGLIATLLAGCKSAPPPELASVFVEIKAGEVPSGSRPVRLPVSGIDIHVAPRAVVMAERITSVAVVTAGESDLRQNFVMVTLDGTATQDIALLTRETVGRSLVLVIGSEPVGLMRIEQPMGSGRLFFHVEQKGMSNAEAPFAVAARIEKMIEAVKKAKER